MRTTVAILLLVLFTVTQTPLGQILKLPLLIEHFCGHKKQDGVSLLEFLKDHYAKEHNDADQREDEQLPFKTVLVQNIGFALVPGFVRTEFTLSFDGPKKAILKGSRIPQQHLGSIFHPPRV